jgi:RNA-directed DNA polymerase
MKRSGNLWPQLTSWENLLASALAAARGKRKRPDVARFLFHLEPNLCSLQRELLAGTWVPGKYRTFWIHDPKPRMISAAPFRDRVVHHAVTRVLETVFEPRFSASSFASRRGFGQHKAVRKALAACARHQYVFELITHQPKKPEHLASTT